MSFNHKSADNGQKIGILFSQYFSSVYKDTALTNNNFQSNIVQSIGSLNSHHIELLEDLGILFDSKLLFNDRVSAIKNKALSVFVRSLLEYAPIIWNHNNVGHNDQLDKVQNKALRFLCHTCNIQRTPHSGYDNILKLLNLESLNVRRHLSYSTFLTKLLNNEIDDSFLLSQLNFKVKKPPHS
ncbi:Hypothetical protein CINCED_3A021514 [Cinara cedri]|uniref:Uncharacterized protein n=1 Tax=Cinara cedri TaxID=506608 RepID=A0A5E4NL70_9HEMI|nr:Hypothetical protein CINCED_3A021514 [Cinara cedri]